MLTQAGAVKCKQNAVLSFHGVVTLLSPSAHELSAVNSIPVALLWHLWCIQPTDACSRAKCSLKCSLNIFIRLLICASLWPLPTSTP